MPNYSNTERPSITVLLDRIRAGGTERQAIWLSKALAERGWHASLVRMFSDEQCVLTGPDSSPVGIGPRTSLLGKLRCCCEADILMPMGRTANSFGAFLKVLSPKAKLVSTCRTNRDLPWAYRFSISKSELCLTNSDWASRRVGEAVGIARERIITIENALFRQHLLDLEVSQGAKRSAKRRIDCNPDSLVISNVSTFVQGKNKQALLRAFADSKCYSEGALLLLVGEGEERKPCQLFAEELGISEQVKFLGNVDSIDTVLQASDVFVSTSLRDSMPNAVVEAQAAALPVVAFDTAGVAEAFRHQETGIAVKSGDLNELISSIDSLSASQDLRYRYANQARLRTRRIHSPDRIADRYDETLRRVLNG